MTTIRKHNVFWFHWIFASVLCIFASFPVRADDAVAAPVCRTGPGWELEVVDLVPYTEHAEFLEMLPKLMWFEKYFGMPCGFALSREMSKHQDDYVRCVILTDCTVPIRFGRKSRFVATLGDGSRVSTVRLLFVDGRGGTNMRLFDTRKMELNMCTSSDVARVSKDGRRGFPVVLDFPLASILDLDDVEELEYQEGGE